MKTSELTGAALDWAVAKCEGVEVEYLNDGITECLLQKPSGQYAPSTDWAQGGAIIEREKISLVWTPKSGHWTAVHTKLTTEGWEDKKQDGETPLIAAMRCYVASKLGDEIEIPEELT